MGLLGVGSIVSLGKRRKTKNGDRSQMSDRRFFVVKFLALLADSQGCNVLLG
jgi:hypothetical protein